MDVINAHESNRLAVHQPERHEALPDKAPRELGHASRGDDADDVRGGGRNETRFQHNEIAGRIVRSENALFLKLSVITPPTTSATICVMSPTLLSTVVLVAEFHQDKVSHHQNNNALENPMSWLTHMR